jgi:hypothetical protein
MTTLFTHMPGEATLLRERPEGSALLPFEPKGEYRRKREEGREFVRVESCGVPFGSFRIREGIRPGNNRDRASGAVV